MKQRTEKQQTESMKPKAASLEKTSKIDKPFIDHLRKRKDKNN